MRSRDRGWKSDIISLLFSNFFLPSTWDRTQTTLVNSIHPVAVSADAVGGGCGGRWTLVVALCRHATIKCPRASGREQCWWEVVAGGYKARDAPKRNLWLNVATFTSAAAKWGVGARWEKWRGGGELWTRHFLNYFLFGCVSSHPVRTTGISQWYRSLRVNVQHTRLTSTPRSIFPLYFTRGQQIGENKKHEILLKSVKMKNSIINASSVVFSVFFLLLLHIRQQCLSGWTGFCLLLVLLAEEFNSRYCGVCHSCQQW